MEQKDIITIMRSKGYHYVSSNDNNINFTKQVPDSQYFVKAHAKDWRGPWAVNLRFVDLKHKIELRTGDFYINNPDFDKYEHQLFDYIKTCLEFDNPAKSSL